MVRPSVAALGFAVLAVTACSNGPSGAGGTGGSAGGAGGGSADGGGGSGGETVTAKVGAAGGQVKIGAATISIPQGALATDVDITINKLTSPSPEGYAAYSSVFEFKPAGQTFAVPVRVSIPFTGADPNATLFWTRLGGGGFEGLPSTVVAGAVEAQVTHFSQGFVANPLAGFWQIPGGSMACAGGTPPADPAAVVAPMERWFITSDGQILALKEKQNWATRKADCCGATTGTFCHESTLAYVLGRGIDGGANITVTGLGRTTVAAWLPDRITSTVNLNDGGVFEIPATRVAAFAYSASCVPCPY